VVAFDNRDAQGFLEQRVEGEMRVSEFEQVVQKIEGFRIVVRAPAGHEIGGYNFERAAISTWTINEWINARFDDNQKKFDVVVLNGRCQEPQRNTRLETLRHTYG
jgi:hypothetical protein